MVTDTGLLSLHAFVAGRENEFLASVVAPVLQRPDARIDSFFFLRYWRGGPHLRLRFRLPPANRAPLQARLIAHFSHWCTGIERFDMPGEAEHAALALRFAALEGVAADTALVACPALVAAPYQPESQKYGGDTGLALAEAVWHASSAAIMTVNHAALLHGGTRLGLGLQMALVALKAFGLDLAEAREFFDAHARTWQHYCPGPASAAFEAKLARQASAVRTLATRAWALDMPVFLHDWYDTMLQAHRTIAVQAGTLAAAIAGAADLPPGQVQRYLLSQYLHTNNNRLGISPAEEWLLARLAHAALEWDLHPARQEALHG